MSSVSSTSSGSTYYYILQKKMFDRLDTDQNGSLDQNELQSGKQKTTARESKLYDALDADKSGAIGMNEFAAGTQTGAGIGLISQLSTDALDVLLRLQQQGGGMPQAGTSDTGYDVLDTDGDGVVSEDEFLVAHPEQLADEEARSLSGNVNEANSAYQLFSLLENEPFGTATTA
jgi:Ca2+-binding EF-hand superfamily protein